VCAKAHHLLSGDPARASDVDSDAAREGFKDTLRDVALTDDRDGRRRLLEAEPEDAEPSPVSKGRGVRSAQLTETTSDTRGLLRVPVVDPTALRGGEVLRPEREPVPGVVRDSEEDFAVDVLLRVGPLLRPRRLDDDGREDRRDLRTLTVRENFDAAQALTAGGAHQVCHEGGQEGSGGLVVHGFVSLELCRTVVRTWR
jgi:hypothetical protein